MMGYREYARHRQVSLKTVQEAVKSGRIPTIKDKRSGKTKIDPAIADRAWEANTDISKVPLHEGDGLSFEDLHASQETGAADDEASDEISPTLKFMRARAEKEYWAAELKRLDFEKKALSLIPAEGVKRELFNLGKQIKESLLNLPAKISGELAAECDPHKISILLEKELRLALTELCKDEQG